MSVEPGTEAEVAADQAKPKRGFPSPLSILLGVLVGVWLLALVIPSGRYDFDADGRPIPGSFHFIESGLTFGDRVADLLLAPINGMLGILDTATGMVGPFNAGILFGSAQVFLFIVAIGGFMTVVFETGALDRGIGALAHRFSTRGPVLIVVLSILFGFLGSVMSWSDESLGFFALMIPLMLALGYDRLVTVAVVTIAPFVGSIGATVSPFRIGIGSDGAGVTLGDGIVLRVILFVVTLAAMIIYTLRYARKVQSDPSASIVGISAEDADLAAQAHGGDAPKLSGRDISVLSVLAFTFGLLIFSIVPWGAILNNTKVDPITHDTLVNPFAWELGWWLPELSALFIVMALVVAVVGRIGEKRYASAFMRGVADFVGPAFLVVLARGVSVILTNTKTIDTILNAMEGWVSGTHSVVFILLLVLITLPLNFLVGSGSAGMALVMPILAPLGDFAGVDRSLVVTTYNAIGAWFNLILPINAILMAGLALAKVGFDKYIKFITPLMAILLGLTVAILLIGAML